MQPINKAVMAIALSLMAAVSLPAQAQADRYLTLTPPSGLPIIPVMEGWIGNEDGSRGISFGFINRNEEGAVDIPLGENNYIEPAQFNGMQPTHFPAGRGTGVFMLTLPAELAGEDVWWYLKTGASEVLKVPGRAGISAYELDFILPRPQGTLQPHAGFGESGERSVGLSALVEDFPGSVTAGSPVTLIVNALDPSVRDTSDPRFEEPIAIGLHWFKHQGPGDVEFTRHESTEVQEAPEIPDGIPANFRRRFRAPGPEVVSIKGGEGVGRVIATFSEPGEYLIRTLVENYKAPDSSAGDQCCWTNIYQRVTVSP